MDSDSDLVVTTSGPTDVFLPGLVYPNTATEVACSFLEEILPNLEFVQLSDFKTQLKIRVELLRGDQLIYKMLLSQFNNVDWDFVGLDIRRRQNVQISC